MKILFLLIVVCSMELSVKCQEKLALMQMVNAEKSFAGYARSTGITEAFLKFLDDSARVFEQGKILNGKEVWKKRKTDSMELRWYPEFAEVAASGDFGYTTGPSEFRLKKGSDKADHKGYFNSIWKKDKNGEWKVVLDMGTPSPQSEYDESKVEYADKGSVIKKPERQIKESNEEVIKKVEENFIANYDGGKGYTKFGSAHTRYYRPGTKVIKGSFSWNDSLRYQYKNAGTGIASSGDLGYTYGYIDVSGKTGNYLRVWKKDADVWRIMLDVATY